MGPRDQFNKICDKNPPQDGEIPIFVQVVRGSGPNSTQRRQLPRTRRTKELTHTSAFTQRG